MLTSINLSKEAVNIAERMKLNVSQMTEMAIRSVDSTEKAKTYVAYAALFKAMQPLLDRFDPLVLVGQTKERRKEDGVTESVYYFRTKDALWKNYNSEELDGAEGIMLEDINVSKLLPGTVILKNMLQKIVAASADKDIIRDLSVAHTVVKAIAGQFGSGYEDLLYNEERDVAEAKMREQQARNKFKCHRCSEPPFQTLVDLRKHLRGEHHLNESEADAEVPDPYFLQ